MMPTRANIADEVADPTHKTAIQSEKDLQMYAVQFMIDSGATTIMHLNMAIGRLAEAEITGLAADHRVEDGTTGPISTALGEELPLKETRIQLIFPLQEIPV
jgi:hypothetical protein